MASDESSNEEPQRETRRLLQRLYTKLNKDENEPPSTTLDRMAKYTGLTQRVIKRLGKREIINVTNEEVDRGDILKILIGLYIDKKIVPTTKVLFNACDNILPEYMDISGFRKLLFKYDFVWKKMPNNTFAVLERPEATYERYQYLKSVSDQFNNVCFIEETAYSEHGKASTYSDSETDEDTSKVIFAMSSRKMIGWTHDSIYEYTTENFKNFMIGALLPQLQNPTVIVYSNAEHHCELSPDCCDLTIDSLRYEMTDWLDRNNIPYDTEMSKVELYTIIKNTTDTSVNKYLIDNIIISMGHTPLRIPDNMISLTPGQYAVDFIKRSVVDKTIFGNTKKIIAKVIPSIGPDQLKKWFDIIFNMYEQMYEMEMKYDQALDCLLQKVDQSTSQVLEDGADDSDLPSLSEDSE